MTATTEQPSTFRTTWLSYRKLRFWLILLPLLYAVTGFLLVPVLVNKFVVDKVRHELNREASFTAIKFNPFVLSLKTEGFRLSDTDGETLMGFDEFLVNFQLSSLFRWALTFSEVRLDGFYMLFERFEVDDSRLSRILQDAASTAPAPVAEKSKSGELPRLLIHELSLNKGSVDFRDHVPETPVELKAGPVNISIQELNTLPDRYGQQSVVITLPDDAILRWQGNISLAPLESEGQLSIENSHLDQAIAYLNAILPLNSIAATLAINTHYRIFTSTDNSLDIELDNIELNLSDVAASGLDSASEFLALSSFSMSGGEFRYPEKTLNFASAQISNPALSASLAKTGKLDLLALVPKKDIAPEPDRQSADASAPEWNVGIDEVVLDGGEIYFTDNSLTPPVQLGLSGLQVSVLKVNNLAEQNMPVSATGNISAGGSVGFNGDMAIRPGFTLSGQAVANEIELAVFQPYVQQKLNTLIETGALSAQSEISLSPGNAFTATGNIGISHLKIRDTVENEDLLAWDQLDIDLFELDVPTRSIKFSRVMFEKPYGRIEIKEDRSSNISKLLSAKTSTIKNASPTDKKNVNAWSFVIGGIAVNDGSMDFSDLSLPLPFGTRISGMDGTISTIDSVSAEPAAIRLEGQVDEFGLARIEGTMSLLDPVTHTDISVEFRNLLMSNLSPYSAEFAGQKIDEGKLNLNLGYFIDDGKLNGSNKVVLSDLVLGEKVDNPEAASLPLELAVALLTDAEGVIDIDLPVEGNINDPEFKIGGVITKALVGLITKIVSAPFRLLGKLIGIDSENLGQFQFLAGRSDLTPPELEKTTQLQQALLQRPELRIEITGPYDPAVDVPKLKYFRLRNTVMSRLGKEVAEQNDEIEMLDVEIRTVLESLFEDRFPEIPLESVRSAHTAAPGSDPKGKPVFEGLAYSADLRDRLLAADEISQQNLEDLATARAEAIRSAFLTSEDFSQDRITIAAPAEFTSEDGEWVVTELGVATN